MSVARDLAGAIEEKNRIGTAPPGNGGESAAFLRARRLSDWSATFARLQFLQGKAVFERV